MSHPDPNGQPLDGVGVVRRRDHRVVGAIALSDLARQQVEIERIGAHQDGRGPIPSGFRMFIETP